MTAPLAHESAPFKTRLKPNHDARTTHHFHIRALMDNVRQAVVVDPHRLEMILAAVLAQGHVLLDDVPGMGKTLVAKALARSVDASFKRIQCTPDLLPADITGSAIYNQRAQRFEFAPGPIFANVVLVDEINRASPRTQSSLLESMAEGQVSADGFTHKLEDLFFVIATQNPVESAGTFPLPEAQLDRFLISLDLGYPSFEDEVSILEREEHTNPLDGVEPVATVEDILRLQQAARAVDVVRPLKEYIVRLINATRTHPDVVVGVSPRGGVAMQKAIQALALIRGRSFATPDDVKSAAHAVMAHRLLVRDRRLETAHDILGDLLRSVPISVE